MLETPAQNNQEHTNHASTRYGTRPSRRYRRYSVCEQTTRIRKCAESNARVEGQIKPASDGSIKDITFDAFDALKEFESTLDDIFSPLVA